MLDEVEGCLVSHPRPRIKVTRFKAGVAGPPVYACVAKEAVSSEYLRKMPIIFVHV